jgi:5,10-methylenetetrahydrofolate reductase
LSCPRPRVILEFWYPPDLGQLTRLHSRGLLDLAFAPDLPFGYANADSLVAALAAQSSGVPALAAISLGGRGASASISRIATAYASALAGVVLVAGDSRSCSDALGVLDAIRIASSLPAVPDGVRMSAPLRASLADLPCFIRGAAVDLGSAKSVALARSKAAAGANLLMSQLMPDPASRVAPLGELSALGIPVALGIPYAPTDGARARLASLIGSAAPSPAELLKSIEGVPREMRTPIYVSPIGGDRSGLGEFLESLASLI